MRRLVTAVLVAVGLAVPAPAVAAPASEDRPAVVEARTIGHSVKGRPIRAWRLGEPGKRRIVLVSTMHGDEPHTRAILETLRDGRAIRGVDLWVVPTYNPDGRYESGRRPASEPETRAVMAFLEEIDPVRVVSFHQPLNGVDTDTLDPRFARRLARALRLPRTSLDCGGLCHGTMTMWFNHRMCGSALTVEYGARPPRHRMVVQAPRQLLGALGAHRTSRG